MSWVTLTLNNGEKIALNLDHVVAVEQMPKDDGARIRTAIVDLAGKPVIYVVQEPWSVVVGTAERQR
jgi:hypothetical protein